MKTTMIRALALAALSLVPAAALAQTSAPEPKDTLPPAPAGQQWKLVWQDEFNGPKLDETKWNRLGDSKRRDGFWIQEDAYLSGKGTLLLRTRKDGDRYTCGAVNTRGKFEQGLGRWEARIRVPSGMGIWPAYWLLGANYPQVGWPACGEIDIMENVGFEPTRIHGTVHTAAYNHVQGTAKGANVTIANPWEDFHVYAMEWYADRIDVFVDGQKYFTFRNEGTGSAAWPFDKPQYLLINLAIGGSWGGQRGIDDTRFPHRYVVDYVRVYQQR